MDERFKTGLRQRKKERLREELRRAATALFLERGVDATTVDDIVAQVDVSRRTFFRYFEGKEDAWFGSPETERERLEREIRDFPGDAVGAAQHAYRALVLEHFSDPEQGLAMARLVLESPALHAKYLLLRERSAQTISHALARRLRLSSEDLYPCVVALTTVAQVNAALYRWIFENGTRTLAEIVDEACTVLEESPAGAEREAGAS
jgi:AcrR family transcriptional regulator